MHFYVAMLLFLSLVNAESDQRMRNPKPDLLQIVKNAWAVICDLFNIIVGKVVFRDGLALAGELTAVIFPPRPLPPLPEPWWGDRPPSDTSITPFRINWSDEVEYRIFQAACAAQHAIYSKTINIGMPTWEANMIKEMISDLRTRILHRRSLTLALDGTAHTYGTNADYIAHLLDYWARDYPFKKREDWLNSFPQYTTNIQGLSIHFIHVKPPNPHRKRVLTLLLLHGWPATAFEYVHVIQHLLVEREDCDFVFEMVAPDLPGYAYSEATNKIGMAPYQMGIIMKNLMQRLGKGRFFIHAGDAGQLVADSMAVLFPDRVLGLHTNFAFSLRPETLLKHLLGQLYPPAVVEPRYEDRMYPLTERAKFYLENTGYFHVQTTKPDNVGHGTVDSPVAQTAWLVMNIITGAGPSNQLALDGNLTRIYDTRDWLDSFTVYWDSRCMATSVRSYAETLAVNRDPITVAILTTPTFVPFAAIRFREEIIYQPDDFLRDKYPNLVQANTLDFGGHFAGYEEPGVLADSIWTSVKKMESYMRQETSADVLRMLT